MHLVRLSVTFRVLSITYLCIDALPYNLVQMFFSLRQIAVTLSWVPHQRSRSQMAFNGLEYICSSPCYNLLMH